MLVFALSYVVALRVLAERIHSLDFFSHLFLLNPTYRLLPTHTLGTLVSG